MNLLVSSIQAAGIVQLGIVLTAMWVPRVMNWRELLAPLHNFMRRLLWVYAAFIMGVNLWFAALSLAFAKALASGGSLSRSVCGFMALYWLARLCVQWFVFDARPLIRRRLVLFGYHSLTAAFAFLATVYSIAAMWPQEVVR
jgi:hypothetical protein